MFRRFLIAPALLALLCGVSAAQNNGRAGDDENSGMLYGRDYAFTLTAREGWVLDNESGVGQGLQAVFYPKGSSWQASPAVMYANVVHKKGEKDTLESVIEGDVASFQEQSHNVKVTDAKGPSLEGRTVRVKYFTGDQSDSQEAVAYVGEGKVVVMLVLSARAKKDFEASLPAFNRLVSSYHFLSDKVVTAK